ncbi:MAG: 16S rRNA (guanine(966)-N(2))-methyltransferase RsmD [Alphaproteobacteria bacterium]|jgi:16S rRNA (guanine966-N2)-methyltransferase|nr:16S rRNA (guanine(966)-N(2))-methyltransferase RsmD [Alphaproteobacteria bacterium]MDP6567243.1 16S rRNA (guanine(966)-N(2))-methyltransferase RsmD [Alphaproteobacteria bacterium]MDP6812929.1 16S rRNA (guanine(966)-N(2))-methyltransferase RsmD [Alphaproteobacteria bacterium]
MRIVGGKHKGRRLIAPAGRDTRPSTDRTREALFNILSHGDFAGPQGPAPRGMAVLDVFAGSGALGLEALSRGAARVTFIERGAGAIRAIEDNLAQLDDTGQADILPIDARRPGPAPARFDLVLMDPPYRAGLAEPCLTVLARDGWLAPAALAVVELAAKEAFEPPNGFDRLDRRRYGAAALVFLRWVD